MIGKQIVILWLLACSLLLAQSAPLASVPRTRTTHLRRGINLSAWFAQVYDPKGIYERAFPEMDHFFRHRTDQVHRI
jgi:hypothetical protein